MDKVDELPAGLNSDDGDGDDDDMEKDDLAAGVDPFD